MVSGRRIITNLMSDGLKLINHICITLNEFCQGKKIKDIWMMILETMAEKTQFEVEFTTIDTCRSERTITKASDYHLTHDKLRTEIVPS